MRSFIPCVVAVLVASCAPEAEPDTKTAPPPPTDRIHVPASVVGNLGITFERATRGRLGVWQIVPGQLEVPESRRWTLRAPARGRLLSVVARWQVVARGDAVATLTSAALPEARRGILRAQSTFEHATIAVAAARARLLESEAHLREAQALEAASRERLAELQALVQGGNALSGRELIEAQRTVTDAGKASLDAAIARDGLRARIASQQLEADQAELTVGERLHAMAVLTGRTVAELTASEGGAPAWRQIETLAVRAPAAGVVVDLLASQGETLAAGAEVARMFDTSELRFRGRLPEGDLGALSEGLAVRLEFPSRRLPLTSTRLRPPVPVADAETRMILVEADVDNSGGVLAHGMSAMARVLVEESAQDEVLVPARCVVFDGLEAIVFRRDPDDPEDVIRTPVDLGARTPQQVEVLAGVLAGDELVAAGVHQLVQTGLGATPEGGHVHADGTWHEDHK